MGPSGTINATAAVSLTLRALSERRRRTDRQSARQSWSLCLSFTTPKVPTGETSAVATLLALDAVFSFPFENFKWLQVWRAVRHCQAAAATSIATR